MLEDPQVISTLLHLILLFLENDEGIKHLKLVEVNVQIDREFIGFVDESKNECHDPCSDPILAGVEPLLAIEVFLKVEC